MNLTKDQLKQNAAAMMALAAGQPIQFRHRSLSHKWEEYMPTIASAPNWSEYEYRPAPDPIAPGHNPDKLTVSQVGKGWRLLDADEIKDRQSAFTQIQLRTSSKAWDELHGSIGNCLHVTYRTRLTREELAALDKPKPKWQLPAPPAGQKWHRDDFIEADLPEGWRPLLMGEEPQGRDEIDYYGTWRQSQCSDARDSSHFKTRTRRPLPSAPKAEPWDSPEDVPGPVCWIGWPDKTYPDACGCMVVMISRDGVSVGQVTSNRDCSWSYLANTKAIYSTDRINWKPCTKEAKA